MLQLSPSSLEKLMKLYFCFDAQLAEYLAEIYAHAVQCYTITQRLRTDVHRFHQVAPNVAEKEFELMIWFSEQLDVARGHFRNHIHLA
jgi:hypothetical protein